MAFFFHYKSHRDIRNSQKSEHIIQVQLRFCLLETSSEQEDYFPPNVIVKVNNKLCPLPVSSRCYEIFGQNPFESNVRNSRLPIRIPFRQISRVLSRNDHHGR